MNFKKTLKTNLSKIPKKTGVYVFISSSGEYLYIGKAVNIRKRIKNHLSKPNFFLKKSEKIGFLETDSEIEALIKEAELIKKYKPRFNVMWRDDKNYFYVTFKGNPYYISITHQPEGSFLGPFIDGRALKKTLRILRRVFPYYTVKKHPSKLCNWCHLGLCPGPNANIKKYKSDMKKVKEILKGKRKSVIRDLKKEMKKLSQTEKFEKAGEIRDKVFIMEKIINNAKVISDLKKKWPKKELSRILKIKKAIKHIEAYDVSNIQGKEATGSMVTFIKGEPDKKLYRKFKIKKTAPEPNDTEMIKEILRRRFSHNEWPYPDLILIDGGKGQLNAALKIKRDKNIIFISLAKKENKLFIENFDNPLFLKNLPDNFSNLILYLRDEAHRFAVNYHIKLRKNKLLEK